MRVFIFAHKRNLLFQHLKALKKRRLLIGLFFKICVYFRKNKGITLCRPPDRHHIAPGRRIHILRTFAARYIAVCNNGDFYGFFNLGYGFIIYSRGVHLRAGSAVNGYCRRSRVFAYLRQIHSVYVLIIIARPHFHGYGNIHCLHNRRHYFTR